MYQPRETLGSTYAVQAKRQIQVQHEWSDMVSDEVYDYFITTREHQIMASCVVCMFSKCIPEKQSEEELP